MTGWSRRRGRKNHHHRRQERRRIMNGSERDKGVFQYHHGKLRWIIPFYTGNQFVGQYFPVFCNEGHPGRLWRVCEGEGNPPLRYARFWGEIWEGIKERGILNKVKCKEGDDTKEFRKWEGRGGINPIVNMWGERGVYFVYWTSERTRRRKSWR